MNMNYNLNDVEDNKDILEQKYCILTEQEIKEKKQIIKTIAELICTPEEEISKNFPLNK